MVVLIIEGCDLAGKGTAIEKIAKHFKKGFLIKNLYKPSEPKDPKIYAQYWEIMHIYNTLKEGYVAPFIILDRFFPSQAVYSYMRGEDEMYSPLIRELDDACAREGFIFILLDTKMDELEKRFDLRGDEHIKKEDLRMLINRYDKFWNLTQMKKIAVDTMEDGWLDRLATFVENQK